MAIIKQSGGMREFFTNNYLFLYALCLAVVAVVLTHRAKQFAVRALSSIINKYLILRYPIRRQGSGEHLPSCPYQWPNGQGDVGKFLEGIENSREWENRFGRVYRIWSGTNSEVVLTRPEHLKAVFKDSNKHLKAIDNNSGYLMSRVLGQCVGLVSGNNWQTLRNVAEVPFQHKPANTYIANIQEQVKMYLQRLEEGKNFTRALIDPAQDMKMLPFWIVAEIIYGRLTAEMVAELTELAPIREELFIHVIKGGLARFSWSQYLPTRANSVLTTFKARWSAFNLQAYDRAKKIGSGAPIISMFDAVESSQITLEQLLQTIDESLYANLDVTTGGLSWNLVFLAANGSIQESLRDEIKQNMNDIDAYVRSSSTLLSSCIAESARLKPLAAFSVPQAAPTDRVVDGYLIPARTNFVVDSYALNIHHDFWGADAKEYRPGRWLELSSSDLRYHFWRFGFGPRQCMGRYVADIIIRVLLIEMLSAYRLEPLNKEEEWQRDPHSWITHPKTLLKCTPL